MMLRATHTIPSMAKHTTTMPLNIGAFLYQGRRSIVLNAHFTMR